MCFQLLTPDGKTVAILNVVYGLNLHKKNKRWRKFGRAHNYLLIYECRQFSALYPVGRPNTIKFYIHIKKFTNNFISGNKKKMLKLLKHNYK